MKPELVEKVARELFVQALMALWNRPDERPRCEAAWDSTAPSERELAHPVDFALARYALALAERAAMDAVCPCCVSDEYDTAEQSKARLGRAVAEAVERAVEGGA